MGIHSPILWIRGLWTVYSLVDVAFPLLIGMLPGWIREKLHRAKEKTI